MCMYEFFLTQVECGLNVGVGKFSDTEIPDLSRFVEYMVSRGSEKYEHVIKMMRECIIKFILIGINA